MSYTMPTHGDMVRKVREAREAMNLTTAEFHEVYRHAATIGIHFSGSDCHKWIRACRAGSTVALTRKQRYAVYNYFDAKRRYSEFYQEYKTRS